MSNVRIALAWLIAAAFLPTPSEAADGPMRLLRRSHARINQLLRSDYEPSSPKAKEVQAAVKEVVNGFLDYRELGRRSLGQHWEARTKKEQEEFVSVLRELIERNYVKQLRSNLDYEVDYRKQSVTGTEATVLTVVRVEKNKRVAETEILYKLREVGRGWFVFDIVTDGVSLIRNYRTQFNRIINKESYPALLKKMKRKLGES